MIFNKGYNIDSGSDKADYGNENIDAVWDFFGARVNDREHQQSAHKSLTQEHIYREPFYCKTEHK